jgi:hypothetical protein
LKSFLAGRQIFVVACIVFLSYGEHHDNNIFRVYALSVRHHRSVLLCLVYVPDPPAKNCRLPS